MLLALNIEEFNRVQLKWSGLDPRQTDTHEDKPSWIPALHWWILDVLCFPVCMLVSLFTGRGRPHPCSNL